MGEQRLAEGKTQGSQSDPIGSLHLETAAQLK